MFSRLILVASATGLMLCTAIAQEYPSSTIRLVHGFAPGGVADGVARVLGDELARQMGQPVITESRPGAGGNIASDHVAKSQPDGYTLAVLTAGHSVAGAMYESLPFDPIEDFAYIASVSEFPFYVAAQPGRFDSLAALLEQARNDPDSVQFGSAGIGTTPHLAGELLALETGGEFNHIPYTGGAAAVTALLGGEIDFVAEAGAVTLNHIHSGTLQALAVTSQDRWPTEPDIPSIAEAGVPGYHVTSWIAVAAPAGTPDEILDKLNAEIVRAVAAPEVQARLRTLGTEPFPRTRQEMTDLMVEQTATWKRVVEQAQIERR